MENNELNKIIIDKVRSKVVVSNLEREEKMKLSKRKQVISIVAVLMVFLLGGVATVNAATNGKLVEEIKGTLKVFFVKADSGTMQLTYEGESEELPEGEEQPSVTYSITGDSDLEVEKYYVKTNVIDIDDFTNSEAMEQGIIVQYESK